MWGVLLDLADRLVARSPEMNVTAMNNAIVTDDYLFSIMDYIRHN